MTAPSLSVHVQHRQGTFEIKAAFTAEPGITTLFGKSGAGKSSLISMIAGLTRPDYGTIRLGERTLFDSDTQVHMPPEDRQVGYVFQDARLFPHMSVLRNLRYGWGRIAPENRTDQFHKVVELLGLSSLLNRNPVHLSGGEKQRVAIGRALLSNPDILLMDEPLASLDAARKSEILPYIETLAQDFALPVVYVSHAIEEVVRLTNSLVLMSNGATLAQGPVEDLMSRLDLGPVTGRYEAGAVLLPTVFQHLEDVQLTKLDLLGHDIFVPGLDLAPGTPLRLRVRARDISVALNKPQQTSLLNMLPGTVCEIEQCSGPQLTIAIEITPKEAAASSHRLLARITQKSLKDLGIVVGTPVWAMIKSVAIDRHSLGGHGRGNERTE
ncbi:molybdenum ABC transporter ATP-binding protein [Magnetovibrio sp. PR-2]|uniref:molybdenum ABC transporter ATP-binding protein n=1 Tax=Magnetovibrio sp. PR-2 TaxID=3120356 RepID=UPI002FCE199C